MPFKWVSNDPYDPYHPPADGVPLATYSCPHSVHVTYGDLQSTSWICSHLPEQSCSWHRMLPLVCCVPWALSGKSGSTGMAIQTILIPYFPMVECQSRANTFPSKSSWRHMSSKSSCSPNSTHLSPPISPPLCLYPYSLFHSSALFNVSCT